jgi:hypothetical protein
MTDEYFATLEKIPFATPAYGVVSGHVLEEEATHPTYEGPRLRFIDLCARPYSKKGAVFRSEVWRQFANVVHAISEPSDAIRSAIKAITVKSQARANTYLLVDTSLDVHQIEPFQLSETLKIRSKPNVGKRHAFYLVEFVHDEQSPDFEMMMQELRDALVIQPDPVSVATSVRGAVVIADAPREDKLSPTELATQRRDALLSRAKSEHWPNSVAVGMFLGSVTDAAAKQRATRERAAGELFGIWSAGDRTFYHPPFQLLNDGRVHPQLHELLEALAAMPSFTAKADANGWGRMDWLYTPRGALSELSLAEEASEDGIAAEAAGLSSEARTPAEVFPWNPAAVIALAQEDAEAISDRR